jgi:hypothetical protein
MLSTIPSAEKQTQSRPDCASIKLQQEDSKHKSELICEIKKLKNKACRSTHRETDALTHARSTSTYDADGQLIGLDAKQAKASVYL